jgi:hypothetical protein
MRFVLQKYCQQKNDRFDNFTDFIKNLVARLGRPRPRASSSVLERLLKLSRGVERGEVGGMEKLPKASLHLMRCKKHFGGILK